MEEIYHYYWKHRLPLGESLHLADGRKLTVLYPGLANNNAGPDFLHAKIRIDERDLKGNVEIHVRASDWHRHHHDSDKAYTAVLLHSVGVDDARIIRPDGSEIPQFVILLPDGFPQEYNRLAHPDLSDIRCTEILAQIPEIAVADWMETLAVERLQTKALRIEEYYRQAGGDWRTALFAALARALGFGLNSAPMESLALSFSLNHAGRHADNPLQLQAILFGQAGMLDPSRHPENSFYHDLCREYRFLAIKYGLQPRHDLPWMQGRTRPQNMPHRRIAMLAAALADGFPLFRALLATDAEDPAEIRKLYDWRQDPYWEQHFSFHSDRAPQPWRLSASARDILTINAVIPFLYLYGARHNDEPMTERALRIYEAMRPESNGIVRQWAARGIAAHNARESQSLLQLQREYCEKGRCLDCRFGHRLLRLRATP